MCRPSRNRLISVVPLEQAHSQRFARLLRHNDTQRASPTSCHRERSEQPRVVGVHVTGDQERHPVVSCSRSLGARLIAASPCIAWDDGHRGVKQLHHRAGGGGITPAVRGHAVGRHISRLVVQDDIHVGAWPTCGVPQPPRHVRGCTQVHLHKGCGRQVRRVGGDIRSQGSELGSGGAARCAPRVPGIHDYRMHPRQQRAQLVCGAQQRGGG